MKNITEYILESSNDLNNEISSNIKAGKDFAINAKSTSDYSKIEKSLKDNAKKNNYECITVYLDKAEPEDLAPIGDAFPSWAAKVKDNNDSKFIVYFAECETANKKVMNALMPIVLDHEIGGKKMKNMVVCMSAINLEKVMPKPMASHFSMIEI